MYQTVLHIHIYMHVDTQVPTPLSIILMGGAVDWTGRVEMSIENTNRYGRICGDGWSFVHADVACRQLGYPAAVGMTTRDIFGKGE